MGLHAEYGQVVKITDAITVDDDEIELSFVRASGPGGQNVNKVSTAVQLRFDLAHSPSIPDGVRVRAMRLAGRRLTQDGVLILLAQRFRTQERNRQDAMERLAGIIREAETPPKPRRATRPTLGSKLRRLDAKSQRGKVKSMRGRVGPVD